MPRQTGPDKATRKLVEERDGWSCAKCGRSVDPWRGLQLHHRLPRKSGGRGPKGPNVNTPANLVVLCATDHDWIESHREESYRTGWLVREGRNPANTPLVEHHLFGRCFLNDDGTAVAQAGVRTAQFQMPRIPPPTDKDAPVDLADIVRARQDEGRAS